MKLEIKRRLEIYDEVHDEIRKFSTTYPLLGKVSPVDEQIEWLELRLKNIIDIIRILGFVKEFSNNIVELREELEFEKDQIITRIKQLKGDKE